MISALVCGRFELELGRPLIMGIVNVTPDSFSSTSSDFSPDAAIAHARQLIGQGADMLDIGGESTRPGAEPVSAADEVEPDSACHRRLARRRGAFVGRYLQTRRHARGAGCRRRHDQRHLRVSPARRAGRGGAVRCGLCVMHMQGEPRTMQQRPRYGDVLREIGDFLRARVGPWKMQASTAGASAGPGFRFRQDHRTELFAAAAAH